MGNLKLNPILLYTGGHFSHPLNVTAAAYRHRCLLCWKQIMKEANRTIRICQKFVLWLLNVFEAKFYRASQKSHALYAIGFIARYCVVLCGTAIVVQIQFQSVFNMMINFVPAETKNYLNGLSAIILYDLVT